MNAYFTSGGVPVRTREGFLVMQEVEGAPTALPGAPQLAVSVPDDLGQRTLTLTMTEVLGTDITEMRLNFYGVVGGVRAGNEWPVPAAIVAAMQSGAGTFDLPGSAAEWLGPLAGVNPSYVEVMLRDANGNWGLARNLYSLQAESFAFAPFVALANPVLPAGPLVGGDPLTYTPLAWTGEPTVAVAHVMCRAESSSGTNPGILEPITGLIPYQVGALTHMRVQAQAVGDGVAAPSTVYPSAWTEIAPTEETEVEVEVANPPLLSSNRVLLDGIVNATFTAGATITATGTGGAASAKIIHYVDATKALYLGPITGGVIDDNDDIVASSGGIALANGAAVPWQLTAGEPFYLLPPTFLGEVKNLTLIQKLRDDATDITPTVVQLNNSMPKHYGIKQYNAVWQYGGFGITTYQEVDIGWTSIGTPTLTPVLDAEWLIVVAADPLGDRVVEVWVKDSLDSVAAMVTTSSQAAIDANPFPQGFEPTTYVTTTVVGAGGVVYRKYLVGPAVHGGKDYMVFGPDDVTRRTHFGLTVQIGGAWSPLSNRMTVPVASGVPTGATDFTRLVLKNQTWAESGELGGLGMQYIRAFSCDGDYIVVSFDVTFPSSSDDFGENWQTMVLDGLYAMVTTTGIVCDGKYVHGQFGPLFWDTSSAPSYDQKGGSYRFDRNTEKWAFTKALAQVYGSNASPTRVNLRYIAKVAGSGSDPDTRTLFQIHAPSASGAFSTIQVLKSTSGGAAGTWAADGASIGVGTYGVPYGITADATALYLHTSNCVARRPFFGDSADWKKATGLPAGNVLQFEKHGSKLYACAGNGLYTANDATTPAFTLFKQYDEIRYFAVCPTNSNRILVLGDNGKTPRGTHNANAATPAWFDIDTQPFPEQPEVFEHRIHGEGCSYMWHPTDPDVVFAMRFHHFGKSVDGGRTFRWASRNVDYTQVRSISFHPTDPFAMFMGCTDRIGLDTEHGVFMQNDSISAEDKGIIEGYLNTDLAAFSGDGALILTRPRASPLVGENIARIYQVGENTGGKVVVVATRGITTTGNDSADHGNGAITVTASPDLPAGRYTLTCTVAGATGTFAGMAPMLVSMGNFIVGTPRTWNHPRRGSITISIADGSINFTAGTSPKKFDIEIENAKDESIRNPNATGATYTPAAYGSGRNPAVPHRGFTGRAVMQLAEDGSVSVLRSMPTTGIGYMGTAGTVILGYSSKTQLRRSTNEGVSFTNWASNAVSFAPTSRPIVWPSKHDDARAYFGTVDGKVKKVQETAGVVTVKEIFSFDAWCTLWGVSGGWPGSATVNGRLVPPIMGVVESRYDENLIYFCAYIMGAPYGLFRIRNALAGTPVAENITRAGAIGAPADIRGVGPNWPIALMTIHDLSDEPILCTTHGTILVRPAQAHLNAYGITFTLSDYLRTLPGGRSYDTAKL